MICVLSFFGPFVWIKLHVQNEGNSCPSASWPSEKPCSNRAETELQAVCHTTKAALQPRHSEAAKQLGFHCQINFFSSDIKYENCVLSSPLRRVDLDAVSASHFMLILLLAAVACLPRGSATDVFPVSTAHPPTGHIKARTTLTPAAILWTCLVPRALRPFSVFLHLVWATTVFALGLTAIKTDFLLMLMLSLVNLCKSIVCVV